MLPGWQRFYQEHRGKDFEIVAVAMDAQGAARAQPYVERAKATFVNLVDAGNELGNLFGFKAIPNTFLIDERGVFVGRGKEQKEVAQWLAQNTHTPAAPAAPKPTLHLKLLERLLAAKPDDAKLRVRLARAYCDAGQFAKAEAAYRQAVAGGQRDADTLFRWGVALFHLGKKQEAAARWREALALDPQNWVIHKQIWAVEHPERFYNGAVDYAWQRTQK